MTGYLQPPLVSQLKPSIQAEHRRRPHRVRSLAVCRRHFDLAAQYGTLVERADGGGYTYGPCDACDCQATRVYAVDGGVPA